MEENIQEINEEFEIKKHNYRMLNAIAKKGETVFVGSSLCEQFLINELLMSKGINKIIYNRGISGYKTSDMLDSMEEMIFELLPSRIFINIGTNDIASPDYSLEKLIKNYKKILEMIKEKLPKTEVFMLAYYPVNDRDMTSDEVLIKERFGTRNKKNLEIANENVKKLSEEMGYKFINVNDGLTDEEGVLKKEFTIEGIHMYSNAYEVVLNNLISYL